MTRTWHTQLGIFWIATAWLATGLFMAPAVSGHEPKFQRLGVNFLFVCLLIIVVGSLAGQWLAVQQQLGNATNFWFGHQGYEYVDLGRFWQIFLFVGLFLWLLPDGPGDVAGLPEAGREPAPAGAVPARLGRDRRCSTAPGLMWHRQTHLAIAEYWRWWVVHLWVEGFFEVFATVVIAFLFTRMGLLRTATADGRGPVLDHHLPVRRDHRHVPPPLLLRHADGRPGAGGDVQRAGGRAAGADRLRGL